jgi:hypothetical protein
MVENWCDDERDTKSTFLSYDAPPKEVSVFKDLCQKKTYIDESVYIKYEYESYEPQVQDKMPPKEVVVTETNSNLLQTHKFADS